MKPAALSGILLLMSGLASAQLTLLPQLGFDRAQSDVTINQLKFPSMAGTSLKAALRMDYRFKKGHGPYASIGTSPAVEMISFKHPTSSISDYFTSTSSTQWRVEAGYQYSSRPLRLGKYSTRTPRSRQESRTASPFGCGARMSCNSKMKSHVRAPLNVRIQPSAGMAWLPAIKDDIASNGFTYQYRAGNWNTAFVSAMGFELGKGRERLFTVSIHYAKGLGNLDTKTLVSVENGKPYNNSFTSATSNWGMTVGIPVSLSKHQKPVAKKTEYKSHCTNSCEQIRLRCVKKI